MNQIASCASVKARTFDHLYNVNMFMSADFAYIECNCEMQHLKYFFICHALMFVFKILKLYPDLHRFNLVLIVYVNVQ